MSRLGAGLAAVCAAVVCGVLTLGAVLARGQDGSAGEQRADNGSAGEQRADPRLVEIDGLRTATSRTFERPDGTRVAKLYAGTVNFRDSRGRWTPVDNDLVPTAGGFRNAANAYTLELPDSLAAEPVRVEEGAASVGFTLEGVEASARPEVNGGIAEYPDALPGVDVRYVAEPDAVKEELVLEDAAAPTTYRYALNLSPGLEARENAAGGISLVDSTGAVKLSFEPAFMYDSSGLPEGYSDDVSLELTRDSGIQTMMMKLDEAWLADDARVWPVTVDPTLTVNPTKQCRLQSNQTIAACARQSFGVGATTTYETRELFQFDVSAVPSTAYVLSARFGLKVYDGGGNTAPIDVHAVTRPWTTAATWARYDGASSWTTPGGDFSATVEASHPNPAGAGTTWDYWEPRDLVQRWVNGTTPNNGLILRKRPGTATVVVEEWYGSATATVANRPQLVVEYVQDQTNPIVSGVTHSGLGSFNSGDQSIGSTVSASDVGSGIKSFRLDFPGGTNQTVTRPCIGTSASPCSTTAQQLFTYATNTANFPTEGRSTVTATVKDVVGRESVPLTWKVGVDRSPPVISTAGSTLNQGGETLDPTASHTLRFKATDGSRTSDATKRSGVVHLKIETRQMSSGNPSFQRPAGYTIQYDPATVACAHADASCELSYDWVTAPTFWDENGGEYIVKLTATDAVGQSTEKRFSVIAPPRVTLDESAGFIGLEDWWRYETVETGAGSTAYVNVDNGNLVWNFIPITNRGRGLSTVANLTYNSFQPKPKPLVETPIEQDVGGYNEIGQGFSLGISGLTRINERLNVDLAAAGRITLTDRDGTRHRFRGETGNQVFDPPPGVQLHLRRFSKTKTIVEPVPVLGFGELENNDQAWAATAPDGVTHYFDRRGYQTSVEDRNGNKITYSYEYRSPSYSACEAAASSSIFVLPETLCPRKLVAVTDPAGRQLRLRYNAKTGEVADDGAAGVRSTASGTLKETIDHAGRATRFEYNGDFLSRVTQPGGATGARTFDFAYETSGTNRGLIEITEPGHTISANVRAKTVVAYGAPTNSADLLFSKQVASIRDRRDPTGTASRTFAFPPAPARTRVTDSLNRVTEYATDGRGRLTEFVDARNARTLVAWDSPESDTTTGDNNVAQVTSGLPDDPATTAYTWNANGQLLSRADGNNNATTFTYVDSEGHSSHVSPRTVSGGTASIDAGRGFVSDLTSVRRPSGATTTLTYDAPPAERTGNVRIVENPVGGKLRITYGANGVVTQQIDEVDAPTQFFDHDPQGLPRRIVDARNFTWRYCYDERGNLIRATDPRGQAAHTCTSGNQPYSTELTYDAYDRLTREVIPKRSVENDYVTRTYAYTFNGQPAQTIDGTGQTWTLAYTPMDDVSSEQTPEAPHIDGMASEVTSYAYDTEENVIKRESPRGIRTATVDDFTTKYGYDAVDQLVFEHRLGSANAWAATSYAYDLRGNLIGVADPNHNTSPTQDFAANARDESKRRVTFKYDAGDRRTEAIEDPGATGLKLQTQFAYDVNDNLTSVTDPRGTATWRREYDAQDLLKATVDPLGRRTEYTRLKNGAIDAITSPKGVSSAAVGDYRTQFTYELTGELKSRTIPFDADQYGSKSLSINYTRNEVGDPTTITDARTKAIDNTFLDTGELRTTDRPSWWAVEGGALRERTPEEMAGAGEGPDFPRSEGFGDLGEVRRQPTELLPRAGMTAFAYDDELRLTSVTDALAKTVSLNRDQVGRIASVQRPIDATRAMSESYLYDFNGNLARVTDPEAAVTTLEYDELDRLDAHVDPNRVVELKYDRNGNLTRVDAPAGNGEWTYDAVDRRTSRKDGTLGVTSWEHDRAGNVVAEVSPRGMALAESAREPFRTVFEHNAANELTKVTRKPAQDVELNWLFEYDRNGNQTRVDAPGSARAPNQAEVRQVTRRTYDGRDLLWTETTGSSDNGPDDMLRTRVFEFDPNGLPRRIVRPAGVDPATRLPRFTYTGDGQVSGDAEAARNATVFEYQKPDPTLQSSTRLAWNDDDLANRYWQDFNYDAVGRMTTIDPPYENAGGAGTSPAAARTTYTYYDTGWVKSARDNWQTITYDYDRRGLQTRWESDTDSLIVRTYYPSGMLKSRTAREFENGQWGNRQYAYTELPGYLLGTMSDVNLGRQTTFTYDAAGREVKVDETVGTGEALRRGKDTKIVYDVEGNVVERLTDGRFGANDSYAGGKRSTYVYDPLGRQTSMDVAAPNEASRQTESTYWPSGELRTRTAKRSSSANDTVERTFFFSDGRISYKDRKRAGAIGLSKEQDYRYGINGNRIRDERGTYLFNAREQLTQWKRLPPNDSVVTDYVLNPSGSVRSRTTTGQATIAYAYEGDRLVSAQQGTSTPTIYTYDTFGNMSGYGVQGQPQAVTWDYDPFGRMRKFSRGSETTTYKYDGLDRRDTKIEGTRTFDLSYVGGSEALSQEQELGGQAEVRSFDYTGNELERLGMARRNASATTAGYRAYITDAAGSVEALENDDGALVGGDILYRYDPYGAALQNEGNLPADARENPFRFEGHYYDSSPQSYDMRARSYLPEVGRFLQEDRYEDPLGDQALETNLLTDDRYLFAGANPIDNVEWDGHEPITSYNPRGRQRMDDSRGECMRDCDDSDFKGSVSPPPASGRDTFRHWEAQRTPSGGRTFRRAQFEHVVAPPGTPQSAVRPACPGCADKETNRNPFEGFDDAIDGVTAGIRWYVGAPANSWIDRIALIPGLGVAAKGGKLGARALRGSDEVGDAAKAGSAPLKQTRSGLGFTGHGADRLAERGVRTADALDAWRSPLQRGPVVTDDLGRPGQKLLGRDATIVINPDTNKIVTGYPTSRRVRERLLRQMGGGE